MPSLDRLSRSLADLIQIVTALRRRGIGFKSLHVALDTTTPGGRLVFHVFAALAEFIRELIVEGTREGSDAARGRGARLGRPPAMTAEQIRHARDLLTRPDNTVSSHRRAARRQPRHHLQVRPRGHHRARSRLAARTGVARDWAGQVSRQAPLRVALHAEDVAEPENRSFAELPGDLVDCAAVANAVTQVGELVEPLGEYLLRAEAPCSRSCPAVRGDRSTRAVLGSPNHSAEKQRLQHHGQVTAPQDGG